MPDQWSRSEYNLLEKYVKTVLKRHADGLSDEITARNDIMHPLTAWDRGEKQEFAPYIEMKLRQWATNKKTRKKTTGKAGKNGARRSRD